MDMYFFKCNDEEMEEFDFITVNHSVIRDIAECYFDLNDLSDYDTLLG